MAAVEETRVWCSWCWGITISPESTCVFQSSSVRCLWNVLWSWRGDVVGIISVAQSDLFEVSNLELEWFETLVCFVSLSRANRENVGLASFVKRENWGWASSASAFYYCTRELWTEVLNYAESFVIKRKAEELRASGTVRQYNNESPPPEVHKGIYQKSR